MHTQYPATSAAPTGPGHVRRAAREATACVATRLDADRFIIRLEGIILSSGTAGAGAASWLRSIAGRYALVSSNSRDTARTMVTKLRRAGLDLPEQRIVLAGEEALRFAAAQFPGARCKVLASRVLAHAARSHGLELVQDNAEVILLGRDTAWTYQDLTLVVREMARGARLIASNGDMTCLGHGGRPIPDTGAILASIEAAVGETGAIIRFPPSATLRAAQERLGETACSALVISNRDADFAAASAIDGLRCLRFAPATARSLSTPCPSAVAAQL